ncbi:class I tRNA ligase family protein [Candidatus Vidania fulgoroideorum]
MIYNFKAIQIGAKKIIKKYEQEVLKSNRKEFYCISMFPYPSGSLHLGHFRNYTLNDFICRYKSLKGLKSCMYFGWDSFGLPAEKAAIENNLNPKIWVKKNISKMKRQLYEFSLFINWKKEIDTSDKKYYYFNQFIFNLFLKKKLIYIKKNWVNWDKKDKTVLANEQVINGRGWRSHSIVIKKRINMYYIKVKKICDSLYSKSNKLNWPVNIIKSQKKWIGKKKFYCFIFFLFNKKIKVYSRSIIDILLYNKISVSYDFNLFYNIIGKKKKIIVKNVNNFLFKKNKDFFFSGFYAKKFIKNKTHKFPIYVSKNNSISNFFIFKKKIIVKYKRYFNNFKSAYKLIYYIKKNILNKEKYLFKIRDWSLSRQRYWGCPISLSKCSFCGINFEKKTKLPEKKCLKNPLKSKQFYIKKCPKCAKKCFRETDTIDTFFDSSWYFLKYIYKNPFEILKYKKINLYIGGTEHSILHLLYVRIFFNLLKKIKIGNISNPFNKLITHGMILNKSYFLLEKKKYVSEKFYIKNKYLKYKIKIEKMSKSKKNGVDPIIIIKKFGSDSLRLYIFFYKKISEDIIWSEKKIVGCDRFLKKIWNFYYGININNLLNISIYINNKNLLSIKFAHNKIIDFYKKNKINNIVSELMIYFNNLKNICNKKYFNIKILNIYKNFIIFLHPLAPNISIFIWEMTGLNKIYGSIYNNNIFNLRNSNKTLIKINNKNKIINIRCKKQELIKKYLIKKYKIEIKKIICKDKIFNFITI